MAVRASGFPQSRAPLISYLRALAAKLGGAFGLAWGLMAGLRGCSSHGGVIQSRGWLPKVEAPGYSGTQPPLRDAVVNGLYKFGHFIISTPSRKGYQNLTSSLVLSTRAISFVWHAAVKVQVTSRQKEKRAFFPCLIPLAVFAARTKPKQDSLLAGCRPVLNRNFYSKPINCGGHS